MARADRYSCFGVFTLCRSFLQFLLWKMIPLRMIGRMLSESNSIRLSRALNSSQIYPRSPPLVSLDLIDEWSSSFTHSESSPIQKNCKQLTFHIPNSVIFFETKYWLEDIASIVNLFLPNHVLLILYVSSIFSFLFGHW